MWFELVVIAILILYFSLGNSGKKKGTKGPAMSYRIMWEGFYKLMFQLKSDERLRFFRGINYFYPGSVHIRLFKFNAFLCYDPEIMKKIFYSPICAQRPFMKFLRLDAGLLSTKYAIWKNDRKFMNHAFNLNCIKSYIPIFEKHCNRSVKDLENHLDGKEFNLLDYTADMTIQLITETAMNGQIENSTGLLHKMIDSLNDTLEAIFRRIINPFYGLDFIYERTHLYREEMNARNFFYEIGDELIEQAKNRIVREKQSEPVLNHHVTDAVENSKPKYLVDQMLKEDNGMNYNKDQLREHIFTLLITGGETSANLLANAILYLSINQNIQDDLYKEICDYSCSDDTELDLENINQMKLLDRVIKETLRLSSPIPVSVRETLADFDYGKGVLPKGTKIIFYNFLLHTRKDIWGSNANKFNPDNFLPENVAKRHPYSYVPFGAGARNCIGNRFATISTKVMLIKYLKNYQFFTTLDEKSLKFKLTFSGKLAQDHMISLRRRINSTA